MAPSEPKQERRGIASDRQSCCGLRSPSYRAPRDAFAYTVVEPANPLARVNWGLGHAGDLDCDLVSAHGTPADVIEAYDRWVERYLDLAGGALATWIGRWAPADSGDTAKPLIGCAIAIVWRLAGEPRILRWVIDARKNLA